VDFNKLISMVDESFHWRAISNPDFCSQKFIVCCKYPKNIMVIFPEIRTSKIKKNFNPLKTPVIFPA
jgi:hypothetical protein